MSSTINSTTCAYCYIDIDINNHRSNLALSAAFVDATDSRYGFSSKDLRKLGGSEVSRIDDLISMDHGYRHQTSFPRKPHHISSPLGYCSPCM
mmetsp:Transcript_7173/g.14896  ORF Transcript_7173/g.14896 Transcript_7173/m.14896 type:complete len:93 (-) Transcript_7173:924-1202(-)